VHSPGIEIAGVGIAGPEVLYVLAVVVAIAGAAYGYWRSQARREAMFAWAVERGWDFAASDPSLVDRWRGQPFSAGGRKRQATDVLTGDLRGFQRQHRVTSFTYSYTEDSGGRGQNELGSSTTHRFHVMVIDLPAPLPVLELTREGIGARFAEALGGQDIEFESEAFNSAWRVTARDPKFASDIVRPQLMERLLRPDATSTSFRIEADSLLTWVPGASVLEAVGTRGRMMATFVESIPPFVWQDHGYDPPNTSTAREGL
jgi:hypothetical protein